MMQIVLHHTLNSALSNPWLAGCENTHMFILCDYDTLLSLANFTLKRCIFGLQKICHKKSHQLGMIMNTFNASRGGQRQADLSEFEVSLVYIVRTYLKKILIMFELSSCRIS